MSLIDDIFEHAEEGLLCTVNTGAPGAGNVSGMEIEVGGGGIIVTKLFGNNFGNEKFVLTIDDTSQFDTNKQVVTPLCKFGRDADTIESVVRSGEDSNGTIITTGGFVPMSPGTGGETNPFPFYVEPGKFVTFRRTDADQQFKGGIQFFEK